MEGNKRPEMERITTPELAETFIEEQIDALRAQIGESKVLLALSGRRGLVGGGGAAHQGNRQAARVRARKSRPDAQGRIEQVIEVFRNQLDANLTYVDATDRFLDKLDDVADPETKRKIIGAEFIRVFEEEARKLKGIGFLAQGTIYPDIIESGPVKAHHNVGGLPEDLQFELVEPVKFLYKDEVRVVGEALGLPDSMVYRQPFPGAWPGRALRGRDNERPPGGGARDRRDPARRVRQGRPCGQGVAVLHGSPADNAHRCARRQARRRLAGDHSCCKHGGRDDGNSSRTPDWPLLLKITDRILAEVPGVSRVLYDMSPKPPATIEWE